jgi:transposase
MTKIFVGLDISQRFTHLCAVDQEGSRIWQGKCLSTPEEISETIRSKIPGATTIGMESGTLSVWLWHALRDMGMPVVCLHAKHVARFLELRLNKTDKNDARGIAEYLQKGNCLVVNVKTLECYRLRAIMGMRAQLVGIRTDLKNQIRGVLKTYGLVVSHSEEKGFDAKLRATTKGFPDLRKVIEPLLQVLESVQKQTLSLDKMVEDFARNDKVCSHLMTIPGIGAVTALAYTSAVDDPKRFRKSRSVGAYLGLTSRRYQSGEVDREGRISKWGDRLVRSYLFEAASALLTRTKSFCSLKSWGLRVAKRSGMNKARVAVARKLAVIMHQMWTTGEEFRWSNTEVATA